MNNNDLNAFAYSLPQLEPQMAFFQSLGTLIPNFYVQILVILFITGFIFILLKILSQNYLSTGINYLILKFKIPKQISGMTLVACCNGLPDIIDGLEASTQSQSPGIGLGIFLGAFIFCNTIVIANVIKNSPKNILQLERAKITKELGTYFIAIILLLIMDIYQFDYKFSLAFITLYLLYFVYSLILEKRTPKDKRQSQILTKKQSILLILSQIPIKQQIQQEEEQQLIKRGFGEGIKQKQQYDTQLLIKYYFFGHHWLIIDIILSPILLMFYLTIPNIIVEQNSKKLPKIVKFMNRYVIITIGYFLSFLFLFCFSFKLSFFLSGILLTIQIIFRNLVELKKFQIYVILMCQIFSSILQIKIASQIILNMVFMIASKKISKIFLATIVIASGNTIPDFFNDSSLASLGQTTVAIFGCFSGQLFNFLLGFSGNLYFSKIKRIQIFIKDQDHRKQNIYLLTLILSCIFLIFIHYIILLKNRFAYKKHHSKIFIIVYVIYFTIFFSIAILIN